MRVLAAGETNGSTKFYYQYYAITIGTTESVLFGNIALGIGFCTLIGTTALNLFS